MPASTTDPITTDIAGIIACIPHQLGYTPEPSTLVICAVADGRHVATLTLPLINALLAGAPDAVADAVRENGADAVVVVAYHEATIDVICAVADGRHVATLTLPLVNALLAGAPDVVADAVRENGADAAVVVAYHEATIDTVVTIATHMALGLDHRGIDVIGVAQVGLVTDDWRRMTGWVDDDDMSVAGRLSELAGHPPLAALKAQEETRWRPPPRCRCASGQPACPATTLDAWSASGSTPATLPT